MDRFFVDADDTVVPLAPAFQATPLASARRTSARAGPWIAAPALNGRCTIRVANDSGDFTTKSRRAPRGANLGAHRLGAHRQVAEVGQPDWLADEGPKNRMRQIALDTAYAAHPERFEWADRQPLQISPATFIIARPKLQPSSSKLRELTKLLRKVAHYC
jgi:hypothetical protein